jgi:hypothetical protein
MKYISGLYLPETSSFFLIFMSFFFSFYPLVGREDPAFSAEEANLIRFQFSSCVCSLFHHPLPQPEADTVTSPTEASCSGN